MNPGPKLPQSRTMKNQLTQKKLMKNLPTKKKLMKKKLSMS
jgi:hypothetical protein